VVLAADAELVLAADVERIAIDRRLVEGVAVPADAFLRNLG
jgi:hypothetical protein